MEAHLWLLEFGMEYLKKIIIIRIIQKWHQIQQWFHLQSLLESNKPSQYLQSKREYRPFISTCHYLERACLLPPKAISYIILRQCSHVFQSTQNFFLLCFLFSGGLGDGWTGEVIHSGSTLYHSSFYKKVCIPLNTPWYDLLDSAFWHTWILSFSKKLTLCINQYLAVPHERSDSSRE